MNQNIIKYSISGKCFPLALFAGIIGVFGCTEKGENDYEIRGKVPVNAKARKIVFIMTDSQRSDMLGCVNPQMKTPYLDKLASEGTRFEQAYCVSPVCGPSRSSLFTGTFPSTNGVWGNNQAMGDNVKTIGQRLSDNGFRTAFVGKWHLDGTDYFGNGLCPDGWDPDYWYDMRCYLDELSDEEKLLSREVSSMKKGIEADFTFGNRVADKAIDFLKDHAQEDFMLVASFDEPHHPFLCPEPYASMYSEHEWEKMPSHYDDLASKPHYQQLWAEGREKQDKDSLVVTHPYFFASNSYIDFEIGRIIEAINEVCPEALVIYTSDHGDFLQAHSLKKKGPAVYDDVAKVPFLVRWPGNTPQQTVSKQLISHINVVPTILEATGLEIPDYIQGPSALNTFMNPEKPSQESLFMEFGRFEVNHDGFGAFQPLRAIYDGRYKLSINLMSSDELYDMKTDPFEVNNLIKSESHSAVRDSLHQLILANMEHTRDPFRGVYWHDRSWCSNFEQSWEYTENTRSRKDDGYQPKMRDYNTGMDIKEYVRSKQQDKKK